MIVVTVELWPFGNEEHKRTLGVAHIANDGTGTHTVGNYDVTLYKWGKEKRVWKKGRIEGFDRLARGPWDILYLALRGIVGYRSK